MQRKSTMQKLKDWNKKYGGLSSQVQRKIDKLVEQYAKTQTITVVKDNTLNLSVGTKLIREFKGKKYEILVLEKGYQFRDKIYKSLSPIANEITGSRWNGKKFFGVIK